MVPQPPRNARWGDIKRPSEIASPSGVDIEVVSHIRDRTGSVLGTSTKSLECSQLLRERLGGRYDIWTANGGISNIFG